MGFNANATNITKYNFNFKLTTQNGKKGYKWCSKLLMSYQGKNADGSIFEII